MAAAADTEIAQANAVAQTYLALVAMCGVVTSLALSVKGIVEGDKDAARRELPTALERFDKLSAELDTLGRHVDALLARVRQPAAR